MRLSALALVLVLPALARGQTRHDAPVRTYDYRTDPLSRVGFAMSATPVSRFIVTGVDTSRALRITGVRRLGDGRFLVATLTEPPLATGPLRVVASSPLPPGFAELTVYDQRGAFLARTGAAVNVHDIAGRGSDAPVFLGALPGDSTLLACSLNGIARISIATTATGITIAQDSIGPGLRYVFGVFADGSILQGGPASGVAVTGHPWIDSIQVVRSSADLVETAPWSTRLGHLAPRFPATTSFRDVAHFADFLGAQTAIRVSANAPAIAVPPMARPVLVNQTIGTIGDRVWSMDETRWELSIRDSTGKPLSLIRLPMPARNAKLAAGRLAPRDSSYLLQLFADDERRLWIQASETPPPWQYRGAPIAWWVFDEDGTFLGRVAVPATFRPYHVGGGYITGLEAGARAHPIVASFTVRPVR